MLFRPVMLALALIASSTMCSVAEDSAVMDFIKNGWHTEPKAASEVPSPVRSQLAEQCMEFFEGKTKDDRCACRPHDVGCGHCDKVAQSCTWN